MKSENARRVEAILGVFDQATRARSWAKDTDCADCGQSDAGFLFDGEDRICEGCAPQYNEQDLTAVSAAEGA